MTKRSDLISGAIMEVPLLKNLGYAYVKLIDVKDFHTGGMGFLVKIYDKYSSTSLVEVTSGAEFESDNLLIYPLLLSTYPPLQGGNKWKFLDVVKLTEEDQIVPDFISVGKFSEISNLQLKIECQKGIRGCAVIRNFQNKMVFTKDFESIKHMSTWFHHSSEAIQIILTRNIILYKEKILWEEIPESMTQLEQFISISKAVASKRKIDIRHLPVTDRFKAHLE